MTTAHTDLRDTAEALRILTDSFEHARVAALADIDSKTREQNSAQADFMALKASTRSSLIKAQTIVKLNIGGVKYETTKSTLTLLPYFEAFLSEAYLLQPDADGNLFIDRNGEPFRHILSYLRGSLLDETVRSMSAECKAALVCEADFYQAPIEFIEKISFVSVFKFSYSRSLSGVTLNRIQGREVELRSSRKNYLCFRGTLYLRVETRTSDGVICSIAEQSSDAIQLYAAYGYLDDHEGFTLTVEDVEALPNFKMVE
jgi:hypothetical protein